MQLFVQRDFAGANLQAHSRVDPTRTTVIRTRYERDLVRRFRKVQKAIVSHIESDTFGLFPKVKTNAPADKAADFMTWLDKMAKAEILEVIPGTGKATAAKNAWQNVYVKAAYRKGMENSASSIRKAGAKVSDTYVEQAFRRPFHADKVGLIYTQAYSDLEGVTAAMDKRISSTLAKGMATGSDSAAMAKELSQVVSSIGINRARVIARTSVISAHAEASLNTYEEARIDGVKAQSEFSSIDDNKRCEKCASLEGKVFTLAQARGVIPVHPNCRCGWQAYIDDASKVELN